MTLREWVSRDDVSAQRGGAQGASDGTGRDRAALQRHDAEAAVGEEQFGDVGKSCGREFDFANGLLAHDPCTDDSGAHRKRKRRRAKFAIKDEEEVAEGGGKKVPVVISEQRMIKAGALRLRLCVAVHPVVGGFASVGEGRDRFRVQTCGLFVGKGGGIVRFEKSEEARVIDG